MKDINEVVLLLHPTFGVGAMIAAVWLFVESLNGGTANVARMKTAGLAVAILTWLTFVVAGYWYVTQYGVDKALILKGPWPLAHEIGMETKEHIVFMLLLLATALPVFCSVYDGVSRAARSVLMWSSGLVVLLLLYAEGAGAVIGMGVKVALLSKQL